MRQHIRTGAAIALLCVLTALCVVGCSKAKDDPSAYNATPPTTQPAGRGAARATQPGGAQQNVNAAPASAE